MVFYKDYAKVALLAVLALACLWSYFSDPAQGGSIFGVAGQEQQTAVRKFQPDYKYCGSSSAKNRESCKRVITIATEDADKKCVDYLQNEMVCRRSRQSACNTQREASDGCATIVINSALVKADYGKK